MLSLIVDGMFGSMISSILAGPCAVLVGIVAIVAICGCVKCSRCKIRDCACMKRFLRATGHDEFDDFELMMLVHEAIFERKEAKMTTVVRVTAGSHHVRTDPNSNGIFQQPLNIFVEQGATNIVVDLLDKHDRVLATLLLDAVDDVLAKSVHYPEQLHNMKQKGKGIRNPRIKLTMAVQQEEDVEKGLLVGVSSDVEHLVRMQLSKARGEGRSPFGEDMSEMDVLKQACSGPLEVFEGLGQTSNVHVSILGPPASKRWVLGIWDDKHSFDAKRRAIKEVDLLRIQSVQADPARHHVFVINYFDESRVAKVVTFRRADRPRDVWVEVIHLLVQKVRDIREQRKAKQAHAQTTGLSAWRAGRA